MITLVLKVKIVNMVENKKYCQTSDKDELAQKECKNRQGWARKIIHRELNH